MSIILFLGPTGHGLAADALAGFDRHPPARAGDLWRAARAAPRAIALVDGAFGLAPAVWHKEILAVLDAGIPVLGAASLGAIRAAELHGLGMEGVGGLFARYRDGLITRDDAVLVAHAPEALGWRPLSVALVEVEEALDRMPIDAGQRARLRQAARRMHHEERSWPQLAERAGVAWSLLAPWLHRPGEGPKRRDLGALLARLRAPLPPPPPRDPPRLVETVHHRRLRATL